MKVSEIWDKNYNSGRFNMYPFDSIVSFIFKNFGMLKKRSTIKILEVGCGGGNNLVMLSNEGFDFYALDASLKSLDIVKKRLNGKFDSQKIKHGFFTNIPFENNFFDAVIDRASVGCNLSKDLPDIFNEIHRVLKPSGKFFSCDLCASDHPDLKFAKIINNNDHQNFTSGVFKAAHQIHSFTAEELIIFMKKFNNVQIVKNYMHNVRSDKEDLAVSNFSLSAEKKLEK
jgi:ubiquinone/menaquinone biosynthesis C-methylase UbiE